MSERVMKKFQSEIDRFNKDNPVGTPVRYWPGVLKGVGVESKTRSVAQVLGSHTVVVWVENYSGCIALSHVRAIR